MDSASGHGKAVRCTAGIEKSKCKKIQGIRNNRKKKKQEETQLTIILFLPNPLIFFYCHNSKGINIIP